MQQPIDRQRRQRKVIDPMRLVAVTEVAQILLIGQVGFGNQNDVGGSMVDQGPHQPDDFMGFRLVHAGAAGSLPQKRHCIQSNNPHTALDVPQQHVQHLQQYRRRRVVQIDLIATKGAPHLFGALGRIKSLQYRLRAGPDNVAGIEFRLGLKEPILVIGLARQKPLEGSTGSRAMIQHQIRHKRQITAQRLDVGPIP